jgi:hypothetical protein
LLTTVSYPGVRLVPQRAHGGGKSLVIHDGRAAERPGAVALEVQRARHASAGQDRHDELRPGVLLVGQVPRIADTSLLTASAPVRMAWAVSPSVTANDEEPPSSPIPPITIAQTARKALRCHPASSGNDVARQSGGTQAPRADPRDSQSSPSPD